MLNALLKIYRKRINFNTLEITDHIMKMFKTFIAVLINLIPNWNNLNLLIFQNEKEHALTGSWNKDVSPNVRRPSVWSAPSSAPSSIRTVSWPACCRWAGRGPAVGSWWSSACRPRRSPGGWARAPPWGCRTATHPPPRSAPCRYLRIRDKSKIGEWHFFNTKNMKKKQYLCVNNTII